MAQQSPPRSQTSGQARGTQLTVYDRPSSWGSSESDSPRSAEAISPSCYTLSPTCTSLSLTGTIPLVFSDSPLDSQNSTASSLMKLQWKPLNVSKLHGDNDGEGSSSRRAIQSSPPPPVPQWPKGFPQGARLGVRGHTPRISIGSMQHSEYPEIHSGDSDVSPIDTIPPLPSHAYIPEHVRQSHTPSQIALAIGSPSQHPEQRFQQLPRQPQQYPSQSQQSSTLHSENDTDMSSPAYPAAVEEYYAPTPRSGNEPVAETLVSVTPSTLNLNIDTQQPKSVNNTTIIQNITHNNPNNSSVPRVQSPPPTGEWRPPTFGRIFTPAPAPIPPRAPDDQSRLHPAHRRSFSASSTTPLNGPSPFKLNPNGEKWAPPPGSRSAGLTKESFGLKLKKLRGGAAGSDHGSNDGDSEDRERKGHLDRQWKINVATPFAISLLFFCGLISAALHHIFYTQLDNTVPPIGYQQWHVRVGVAIALFTASVWVAAVAICYRQRVWTVLMQRSVKVNGIDALWCLLHDPSNFLVREVWRKSKVAIAIAFICWLIPLITIFVPGSLTVSNFEFQDKRICLVPTFDPPDTVDVSQQSIAPMSQAEINRLSQSKPTKDISLVTTLPGVTRLTTFTKRMGTIGAFSGQIVDIPLPDHCGLNCSYTISFTAPGYKCETRTSDQAAARGPWGKLGFQQLFQSGPNLSDTTFYSALFDNQTISSSQGQNNSGTNSDDSFGMGSFWVASRYLPKDITDKNPDLLKDPSKATKNMFVEEIFQCTDFVVQYSNVKFEYVNGKMSVIVPNDGIRYLAPVNYGNQFTGESDPAAFNRAIHEFTSSILVGSIEIKKTFAGRTNGTTIADVFRSSQIEGTHLLDETRFFGGVDTGVRERFFMPNPNLASGFEQLHQNITLSFLSSPRLDKTFWTGASCTTRNSGLIYHYSSLSLLLPYGIACLFTSLAILTGLFSLKQNGFHSDFSFSRILCTTRGNPSLDEIFRGDSCLGNINAGTEKLGRTELRFGEVLVKRPLRLASSARGRRAKSLGTLNESEEGDMENGYGGGLFVDNEKKKMAIGMGHASFGLVGEVVGLRRDKAYR